MHMITLAMEIDRGELKVKFEAPDQPGEQLRLTELALFALYLDVIKQRITDLTNRALSKGEGYDLVIGPEQGA